MVILTLVHKSNFVPNIEFEKNFDFAILNVGKSYFSNFTFLLHFQVQKCLRSNMFITQIKWSSIKVDKSRLCLPEILFFLHRLLLYNCWWPPIFYRFYIEETFTTINSSTTSYKTTFIW